MTIRRGVPDEGGTFDVCVVGSGPAGLALALACGSRGHSVIVLEAGGRSGGSPTTDLVHILDEATHASLDISTRAHLGGTSSAWGGLCVPYDPIDFIERPWVSASQWPITFNDLSRWHDEAARFLNCGTAFEDAESTTVTNEDLDAGQLGRLARFTALGTAYRDTLAASRHVMTCLDAEVVKIACDSTGAHVIGVDIGAKHGSKRILARRIVIAAGGLRTTRMLLSLARAWPLHFAAGTAPLGKYYMGHLAGEIARLVLRDPMQEAPFL